VGRFDVIVCGAGVGGLVLARALGQAGISVLVVDRQRQSRSRFKGEVLQPRSLEIFSALGALRTLADQDGAKAYRLTCRTAAGAELCSLDYTWLGPALGSFGHCLMHRYGEIKGALAVDLPAGVELRRGVSATRLVTDPSGRVSGVELTENGRRWQARANLTMACDGYASRLRAAAGVRVSMQRYDHQLAAFDLAGARPLEPELSVYLTRRGFRVLIPMPDGRAHLYVQVPVGALRASGRDGFPALARELVETTPGLARFGDSVTASLPTAQVMSALRFNAAQWRLPGLALVGDAAHSVHPMAAQGMNAAIADAWTLSEQLASATALTPEAMDAAVCRYESVRRERMAYVGRLSHNLTTMFAATSLPVRALRHHMLRRNRDNRRLQQILAYNMSGLGVHRFGLRDRLQQLGLPDLRPRQDSPQPGREELALISERR
jgi:2-polyprenyl-6-methoxyphenol hydroxylase-like FAD-dependent oxidoreductase